MLKSGETAQLFRQPSALLLFHGFDPHSPTLQGPFRCVGDCVSERQYVSAAYIDSLSVRDGDLGVWFMPSCAEGEQFASKWLVADSAGRAWLACKYFAVRYRPGFHQAVARVVAIVQGERGTFDRPLATRLATEMAALRAAPPRRDDVVVFPEDLLDHAAIVAALDRRHKLS
jgi:hypothetical protein